MKTLRKYLPADSAATLAARAFADGLDAAGVSGRTVADDLGCDEKTVRNLRAGLTHVRLHHLVQRSTRPKPIAPRIEPEPAREQRQKQHRRRAA